MDFLNRHAVQNPDHALQTEIIANVSFHGNVLALLHQRIGGGGDNQHPARFGNLGIIQGFRTGKDFRIDVRGGQALGGGDGSGIGAHDTVGVGIHFRDHHFTKLAFQGACRLKLLGGFVRVQLVNGKGEGTILFQRHFLGDGIQGSDSPVTAPIPLGGAGAPIVVHGAGADLVNLDGVRPRPIKIGVGQQGFFGSRGELFINQRLEGGNEIDSHLLALPFLD